MHRVEARVPTTRLARACLGLVIVPWLAACDGNHQPIRTSTSNSLYAPAAKSLSAVNLPEPPQPSIEPVALRARSMSGADAALVQSVERAIAANAALSGLGIDVAAVDGTVFLRGSAPTRESRRLATQLAGAVDGVKRVHNELFIAVGS